MIDAKLIKYITNKPLIMQDEYGNTYIGTIVKHISGKYFTKGECLSGDAEQFYRNKIVYVKDI